MTYALYNSVVSACYCYRIAASCPIPHIRDGLQLLSLCPVSLYQDHRRESAFASFSHVRTRVMGLYAYLTLGVRRGCCISIFLSRGSIAC